VAFIHPEARVDPSVVIYPFVFIGPRVRKWRRDCRLFSGVYVGEDCRIGERTIYPNVVLMSGTILGDDVIIHPGAVLGSDGFGYTPGPTTVWKKCRRSATW
jgi:UDP-3-O-[3-hydroxymyristoyl] glucosamine N-acyltransferase